MRATFQLQAKQRAPALVGRIQVSASTHQCLIPAADGVAASLLSMRPKGREWFEGKKERGVTEWIFHELVARSLC